MPIVTGWVDWAVERPGPVTKLYTETSSMAGLVCHSMEGWLAGSFGELDKPSRQASWHFSNALDGVLYQHYPIQDSVWASGNYKANTSLIAVESEGVAGTPLNDAQVATMLHLAQELEAHLGYQLVRGVTLWEHNEVALWDTPNAGPTSCPSHRYDPFFAALNEGGDVLADPRVDDILRALTGRDGADAAARLAAWNTNAEGGRSGNSLLDGYLLQQERIGALEVTHGATGHELVDGDTVTITRVKGK